MTFCSKSWKKRSFAPNKKRFELPLMKNFIIIRTKLLCIMGKSTSCGTKTGLMSVGHVSIVKIFCQICKNSMCIFCRVILSLNRHFLIRSCATWFFRDSFGIFDIRIYPRYVTKLFHITKMLMSFHLTNVYFKNLRIVKNSIVVSALYKVVRINQVTIRDRKDKVW